MAAVSISAERARNRSRSDRESSRSAGSRISSCSIRWNTGWSDVRAASMEEPSFRRAKSWIHWLRRLPRSSRPGVITGAIRIGTRMSRRTGRIEAGEARRDADDVHRIVVDQNLPADDRRIAGEPADPVVVAQHDGRMPAIRPIVRFRRKHPSDCGSDPRRLKEVARDELRADPFRAVVNRHRGRRLESAEDEGERLRRGAGSPDTSGTTPRAPRRCCRSGGRSTRS